MKVDMHKKGITAIVAIVLLLMMTVAAAGLAYMWIIGMQKDVQSGTSEQVNAQQSQTQASLSIDSMWNASGKISFALRNSGTFAFQDMSGFNVYADGVKQATAGWGLSGPLSPATVATIATTLNFPAGGGNSTTIKVVAGNGADISYKCSISSSTQNSC